MEIESELVLGLSTALWDELCRAVHRLQLGGTGRRLATSSCLSCTLDPHTTRRPVNRYKTRHLMPVSTHQLVRPRHFLTLFRQQSLIKSRPPSTTLYTRSPSSPPRKVLRLRRHPTLVRLRRFLNTRPPSTSPHTRLLSTLPRQSSAFDSWSFSARAFRTIQTNTHHHASVHFSDVCHLCLPRVGSPDSAYQDSSLQTSNA